MMATGKETASRHLSLRLRRELYERLDATALAARTATGESRSSLAARLIDEGLRMQAHPGIVFRSGPAGRRPALVAGPDVWEVARVLAEVREADASDRPDEGNRETIEHALVVTAERTGLALHQVRAVARYYATFADEVDDWIATVDAEADAALGAAPLPPG